ncbi:alpha-1,2-fucosyltransferase [Lacinutrix sp. Hel_I_90]|uniref:alpha-1,2-fucosyltransferase n=1 Tax=Lacinutrix sp. Hel_I_90 TaxID=1249999 RepID=UPI0005C87705|nr:alpha-1,2-fucosyltransferase [Lacinutrix sp. Hel_I_90]
MIVIKLIGGLGNQMFQYATAKAIALHKNTTLKLDVSAFENYDLHDYSLDHFNITAKKYQQPPKWLKKIQNKLKPKTYYNEESFRYNSFLFDSNAKTILLNGYFQSEQYFLKYREEIIKDFSITSPLKPETKALLQKVHKTNAVSIHIRRGDFLKHDVHNTFKEEYYKKAMKTIESKIDNPTYYLFSDDMPWVKLNFKSNFKTVYVDFNDAQTAFEDLVLMSNCKHNIIANSSFSWWAAWLNTNPSKIVIAPEQWFNGNKYDYTDVVPETWVKI